MSRIFIQIASYRDPQLIPTINSLLENAKLPENLRIGICRQYHPEDMFDVLDEFDKDKRFKIKNVLYSDSKGVCWARNQIQQLYDGEEYTLQIDSHMRFEKHWDDTLIKMIKQLQGKGVKKPLLTSYAPSFDPDNDPEGRIRDPWRMSYDRITSEGVVFFLPQTIYNWTQLTEPISSRFYSAHFCFTLGVFCIEVQHDPEFYFHGEEISIAVRAYTCGYDLFHPHKIIAWHEYTRSNKVKHWDDDKEWFKKNQLSHKRNRQLLGVDSEVVHLNSNKYGLGTVRTLRDYEKYAGILFSQKIVQQYTVDGGNPPNPTVYETEEEWLLSFAKRYNYCITLDLSKLTETDYDFWAIIFEDKDNRILHRRDADRNEIKTATSNSNKYCKIWRDFSTLYEPNNWVVWPHSKSKGWCDKIIGNF